MSSVQACDGKNHSSIYLPGYGPVLLIKRPVRTRMQGVVGAGGEKPSATRLGENGIFEVAKQSKTMDCICE